MCYIRIRIPLENQLGRQKSAISEKEMAVLGPKNVLFPDKHSRELPGSCVFFTDLWLRLHNSGGTGLVNYSYLVIGSYRLPYIV